MIDKVITFLGHELSLKKPSAVSSAVVVQPFEALPPRSLLPSVRL